MKTVVVCVGPENVEFVVEFLEKSGFDVIQNIDPVLAMVLITSELLTADEPVHAVVTDSFELVTEIRKHKRVGRLPIVYRGLNPERAKSATTALPESADLVRVEEELHLAIAGGPKAPWWRRLWRR